MSKVFDLNESSGGVAKGLGFESYFQVWSKFRVRVNLLFIVFFDCYLICQDDSSAYTKKWLG